MHNRLVPLGPTAACGPPIKDVHTVSTANGNELEEKRKKREREEKLRRERKETNDRIIEGLRRTKRPQK